MDMMWLKVRIRNEKALAGTGNRINRREESQFPVFRTTVYTEQSEQSRKSDLPLLSLTCVLVKTTEKQPRRQPGLLTIQGQGGSLTPQRTAPHCEERGHPRTLVKAC